VITGRKQESEADEDTFSPLRDIKVTSPPCRHEKDVWKKRWIYHERLVKRMKTSAHVTKPCVGPCLLISASLAGTHSGEERSKTTRRKKKRERLNIDAGPRKQERCAMD